MTIFSCAHTAVASNNIKPASKALSEFFNIAPPDFSSYRDVFTAKFFCLQAD
jgi:hypothetical protein